MGVQEPAIAHLVSKIGASTHFIYVREESTLQYEHPFLAAPVKKGYVLPKNPVLSRTLYALTS